MLTGVPKEIKDNEYRVGIVPSTVRELADRGHWVLIETGVGAEAGLPDSDYEAAGAAIVANADAVYGNAELVVKVKEPLAVERKKLRRHQVLSAYLHLAPDREQTEDLLQSGVTAITYDTVTGPNGSLPLLTPMSEVAGRCTCRARRGPSISAGSICRRDRAGTPHRRSRHRRVPAHDSRPGRY